MTNSNIFEKKKLKSDELYHKIKQMIITNELEQASPLSERKLSELLNASRTPIREALRKLYTENFVELTPEYGAFVSRVTYEEVSQIYDIREMLEALAVRLFTKSISKEQSEEINTMHIKVKEAVSQKNYKKALEIDFLFHHYIIQECKNDQLKKLLRSIFEHTQRIIILTQYTDEWAWESLEQHQLLVNCINKKDSSGAERVMRNHVQNSKKHQLEQWINNKL
ncbi:MAG: GntR family transcriptional regulator [Bacteroidetes bacterium]|nr:GntR family transcriptional regulator [Bacteroidota bacterium]